MESLTVKIRYKLKDGLFQLFEDKIGLGLRKNRKNLQSYNNATAVIGVNKTNIPTDIQANEERGLR